MCKSELPQLNYLDLQFNKFWWNDGNVNMLALCLGKFVSLKHALLGWNNYLSYRDSLKLLQRIKNSTLINTLESLHLDDCIWDTSHNCTELANIIAISTSINDIYI